jgi:hypothetical protein
MRMTKTQLHERKYGLIPHSTPETEKACQEVFASIARREAQQAFLAANLDRQANDKNRRHSAIVADGNLRHTQETGRRLAKHHQARNNNFRDSVAFFAVIGFIALMVWALPILGGVR